MNAPPPGPATEPTPTEPLRYRPDLDGLRAIAVGLVMFAHLQWPIKKDSADIGVTAFFVLSGYLITSILIRERERTGRIALGAFYRRRAMRLGPALLGLLVFLVPLGLAGLIAGPWQLGVASSLLYVSNWVQAAGVAIHPFGHTWSLAIEEQFYLLWPLVLIVFWRRALWVALLVIPIAVAVRLVATGNFEYFASITRVDAILVGCVVAFVRPKAPAWIAIVGVIGLLLAGVAFEPDQHDLAIPVAIIGTTLVICGRFEPLGRLAPVGLRAYSLYLWNTPMMLFFGAGTLVAPVMTIAVAELSYRLLERPVLRRGRARSEPPEAAVASAPVVAPAPVVATLAPDALGLSPESP